MSANSIPRSFGLNPRALATALLTGGLLALPLLIARTRGVLLSGQYEESLGYRFFYSWRQLFDAQPYVFLPQGQLMDLWHQCLHLLLGTKNADAGRIATAIETFGFCSVGFAHLLTLLATLFATQRIPSLLARLAVGLCAVLPFYVIGSYGYSVVLQPDYLPWVPALAIFTGGLMSRLLAGPRRSWGLQDTLAIALLVTIALGLKFSLIIYPASLGLMLLVVRQTWWRSILLGITALLAGIAGWGLILVVYFHGHLDFITRFFADQSHFLSSVGNQSSYLTWLGKSLTKATWCVRVSLFLPVALIVAVAFSLRDRTRLAVCLGLLSGACVGQYILFSRDYPVTWHESVCFEIFAGGGLLFLLPMAPLSAGRYRFATLTVLAALCFQVYRGQQVFRQSFMSYLGAVSEAQKQTTQALATLDDHIAFLIPDNSYRPLTIDSAIWKGGANILEGGHFGASERVRRVYPHRDYFSGETEGFEAQPLKLEKYSTVVFTIRKGLDPATAEGQLAAMEKYFHFSGASFRLKAKIDFKAQFLLVWENRLPSSPP